MTSTCKLYDITNNIKVSDLLHNIVELCSSDSNIQKVILYGSWAKGTALIQSDIDLAIEGEHLNLENITDAIEQMETLYTVDLVNLSQCKNDLLKEEIGKYGIEIYSKV